MLTNQKYSPTHSSIADTLSAFIIWIIQLCVPYFRDKKITFWVSLLEGITFIIIYIGIFIFLELVIINRFGMDNNTRDKINIRVDNEENEINQFQQMSVQFNNPLSNISKIK